MSNMVHDLLVHATAAAKAGDKKEAERYLKWILRLDPTDGQIIEAYHWLIELTDSKTEKRDYVDEILIRDPADARARRILAILKGDLRPEDIIDPDRLKIDRKTEPISASPQRYTCPNCGARMVYSPDGVTLMCENCGTKQELSPLHPTKIKPLGSSFTIAMATAKGHVQPVKARIISCRSCGAKFLLLPNFLSGNCPYCEVAYVENEAVEKQIVLPDLLIPFRLTLNDVRDALRVWFESEDIDGTPWVAVPRGFYLPVWVFDIGGQLTWTCKVQRGKLWQPVSGLKILTYNEVPVLATKSLHEGLGSILDSFDLTMLIPYDTRYLANWMTETYQISIGDASLTARAYVLDNEKRIIPSQYERPITDLNVNGSSMTVDTYKLILLPVWFTTYRTESDTYHVVVNGQNGHVTGQHPVQGLSDWISDIFNRPE